MARPGARAVFVRPAYRNPAEFAWYLQMEADLRRSPGGRNGFLEHWANQGVLLNAKRRCFHCADGHGRIAPGVRLGTVTDAR